MCLCSAAASTVPLSVPRAAPARQGRPGLPLSPPPPLCFPEPAILVMHHSMKPHPAITATLLDFMCRVRSPSVGGGGGAANGEALPWHQAPCRV